MQLKATKCPKSFRSLSMWIFRVFLEGRSPELQPRRPAMSFPTQLWSPSLHQQQQRTIVASCHWNCICQRWRRNREGHKPGVQGLQTPVESQWSRHRTQVGPHAQKGLALGSMLCCCHLQIINNRRMATFLFCTGSGKWRSWARIWGNPASYRTVPLFVSSPSLVNLVLFK